MKIFLLFTFFFFSVAALASPEIKTTVQTPWSGEPSLGAHLNRPKRLKPPKVQRSEATAHKSIPLQKVVLKHPATLRPFWVQVGAFSSENNARRLSIRLKKRGYPSQIHLTKNLDHQVLYLVLIGDYSTEKPALHIAEDYSTKANAKAVVIRDGAIIRVFSPLAPLVLKDNIPRVYARPGEKDPLLVEPPDSIFTPSTAPSAKFAFSVGGLYTLKSARKVAHSLKKKGYKPKLSKKQDINQIDWWYVVRIGNYFTKSEAATAATTFFEREHLPTEVMTP